MLLRLHLDPDEGALHDRHADLLDRLARGGRNLAQHDPAHALLGVHFKVSFQSMLGKMAIKFSICWSNTQLTSIDVFRYPLEVARIKEVYVAQEFTYTVPVDNFN